MNRKTLSWLLPLAVLILITPWSGAIDLTLSDYFYQLTPTFGQFPEHPLTTFFYSYALIPGQLMVIGAALVYLLSFVFSRCQLYKKDALYLILVLAVGAGFITHTLLKDQWGRPRPRQIIEFGGQQEFRPWYNPNFLNQPEPSRSFPCGHCTMGFYFFTLVFLGRRHHKKWLTNIGWITAVTLGVGLSITRMAQGGHFFTDVFVSAIIMWLTALTFDWFIFEDQS